MTAGITDIGDVKFVRQIERLHRLGPRAIAELLAEIGARHLIRQPIEATVERYVERLDREMLAAASGDRMPARPLLLVGDAE